MYENNMENLHALHILSHDTFNIYKQFSNSFFKISCSDNFSFNLQLMFSPFPYMNIEIFVKFYFYNMCNTKKSYLLSQYRKKKYICIYVYIFNK